jgi:carboxynorspermidine decarboxylase
MFDIDISTLPTPCILLMKRLLIKNLELLKSIQDRTGCKILLAQKAFSMYSTYPLIKKYLAGTTASGLFEARLGREEMGGEVHIFSPAYNPKDFDEIVSICDHIVFNSIHQWELFRDKVCSCGRNISCGIRINPEYSEIETDIYNPCSRNSRLGTTIDNLRIDFLMVLKACIFILCASRIRIHLNVLLKLLKRNSGSFFMA